MPPSDTLGQWYAVGDHAGAAKGDSADVTLTHRISPLGTLTPLEAQLCVKHSVHRAEHIHVWAERRVPHTEAEASARTRALAAHAISGERAQCAPRLQYCARP